ncbi:exo-alpha-sialidase [Pedobacter nyackensis]|uniref:BNR repeat-like domain-containing protein n=1 Tax=Pedobacter nyackensis TaxID=475255 RepID=A0A1W2D0W4_9SPHI|nr:exo-alpha-sialidase [Pedobacter nyackensis]SMC91177.1 BNR repeat-like domain-containing protein [Pedobacter nyackensis]
MKNFLYVILAVMLCTSCNKFATDVDFAVSVEPENNLQEVQTQIFTNSYYSQTAIPQLTVQKAIIYAPLPSNWHYTHHPSIVYFNGKLISIFSSGVNGEDEAGQRVMISDSEDFNSWSASAVLRSPTISGNVLTPGGLYVIDNKLVVYYTENGIGPNNTRINVKLYAINSLDGVNWSAPIDLGISVFPCHRPTRLSSGRFILTGNRNFYYTDHVSGTAGWKGTVRPDFMPGQTATLVEGSIIEHLDSVYTLFRSTGVTYDGFLWQESSKDGVVWTAPKKTNFTDNNTKSHLGKLPDGRYYYVGTPDTLTVNRGKRTPLVLSTSVDGFNFNQNYIIANDNYVKQYPGRYKDGQFGYPYTIIHDGNMYVILSRQKEQLEVLRFELSQLQ